MCINWKSKLCQHLTHLATPPFQEQGPNDSPLDDSVIYTEHCQEELQTGE